MWTGNGQGSQVVPEISVHVDGTGDLQHEEGLSRVNVGACVVAETSVCNKRLMAKPKGEGLKNSHFAWALSKRPSVVR